MNLDTRSFFHMKRNAIVCKDAVTNKVCGDGRRSPGEATNSEGRAAHLSIN